MRRRTELYWIARGDAGPQSLRYAGHPSNAPRAGEARARYPAGWADDRSRYPGEIALRDLAAAGTGEHALVLARFAVGRWLDRLLAQAPLWEMEAERQAAQHYAKMAFADPDTPPGVDMPDLFGAAATTLRRLAEPPGLPDPDALLAALRQASSQAAALHQPGGALAMARFGYLVALNLGGWEEAWRFARYLADYTARHGVDRAAGRWLRRARALERRLGDPAVPE
jgi:hypothetical protein